MTRTASIADRMTRVRAKRGETPEDQEYENASRSRRTMPVALDDIAVEDRLRAVDPAATEYLAESIDRQGLQSPVLVRRTDDGGYVLVAGAHRIAAARLLGWTRIEAFEVNDLPEDELVLLEIDENLCRAELRPVDKAHFFAARKEVYLRMYPETAHGGDRKSLEYRDNIKWPRGPLDLDGQDSSEARTPSFVNHTASSTAWSPRSIRRYTRLGERLDPELREAIASTSIGDRTQDLERIADMEPEEQRRLLARLRSADEPPKSLTALQKDPTTAAPRPGNVHRLKKLWTRSTEDERAEFQEWLGQLGGA